MVWRSFGVGLPAVWLCMLYAVWCIRTAAGAIVQQSTFAGTLTAETQVIHFTPPAVSGSEDGSALELVVNMRLNVTAQVLGVLGAADPAPGPVDTHMFAVLRDEHYGAVGDVTVEGLGVGYRTGCLSSPNPDRRNYTLLLGGTPLSAYRIDLFFLSVQLSVTNESLSVGGSSVSPLNTHLYWFDTPSRAELRQQWPLLVHVSSVDPDTTALLFVASGGTNACPQLVDVLSAGGGDDSGAADPASGTSGLRTSRLTFSTRATITLSPSSVPPLTPATRYYVGVASTGPRKSYGVSVAVAADHSAAMVLFFLVPVLSALLLLCTAHCVIPRWCPAADFVALHSDGPQHPDAVNGVGASAVLTEDAVTGELVIGGVSALLATPAQPVPPRRPPQSAPVSAANSVSSSAAATVTSASGVVDSGDTRATPLLARADDPSDGAHAAFAANPSDSPFVTQYPYAASDAAVIHRSRYSRGGVLVPGTGAWALRCRDWLTVESAWPFSFSWQTCAIGCLMGVVTYQLVNGQWSLMRRLGNRDTCFYNEACYQPVGPWDVPFNRVISNIAFVWLGLCFNAHIALFQMRSQASRDCSLFYALGWALVGEGVFSGLYHICPNVYSFQFDMLFMLVIATLAIIAVYQTGEPRGRVIAVKYFLAFLLPLMIFNYAGIVDSESPDGFTAAQRATYCVLLVLWELALAVVLYRGYTEPDHARVERLPDRASCCGRVFCGDIGYASMVAAVVAVSVGAVVTHRQMTTVFLGLLLCASAVAILRVGYVRVGARRKQVVVFVALVVLTLMCWCLALYYYQLPTTLKNTTPAVSRAHNHDCVWLSYFDTHDVWHLFSAFGLLLMCLLVLHINPPLDMTLATRLSVAH